MSFTIILWWTNEYTGERQFKIQKNQGPAEMEMA